jgi:putative OPT family oligopeptide transporter
MSTPAGLTGETRAELTLRGLVLGVLITVLFTAANVYFGLKAGLTFATSIPAAVISMAVLRGMQGMTVQENNIVQTVASAAGTLSSIIFVLPGLVIIGWWQGFPYWSSFLVCALGGILGVMYSIPLRRALVTQSDLPYPEGVACAELLKVGGSEQADASAVAESRAGLRAVVLGSATSALFAVIVGTRLFAGDIIRHFRLGERSVTGFDLALSCALFAIGHLVGLWVGIAMGVGALIGWVWGVPHFSALAPPSDNLAGLAHDVWQHNVRLVGTGTIALAAVWTLGKLVKPVIAGLSSAMIASRARAAGQGALLPRTEQDIPIGIVGLVTIVCLLPIGWLLADFAVASGLAEHMWLLALGGVAFVALMSFMVSTVCGYMAGLIGSSNSPLSGIGIIVVIGAALLLLAVGVGGGVSAAGAQKAVIAFALFLTSVVFAVATIANNNLQDLKTGQLVDATPWKQQVALVVGVLAGAAIIPPMLDAINRAFGFAGAPGAGEHALAAPQAGLISTLAQGVITGDINWGLIVIGAGIGAVLIALDEMLRKTTKGAHLSPLAVGLGIYLPTQSTLMVVVGAVAGWYFDRRAERGPAPAATKQLGVLLASGLIVGEGLMGVALVALVVFSGKTYPLGLVGDAFADGPAVWIGGLAFAAVLLWLYRWAARTGQALRSS